MNLMVSRKYTKDYRVEYEPGKGGRLRTTTVYVGDYYSFDSSNEKLARAKTVFIVCPLLTLAAYIAAFAMKTTAGHTLYASMPLAVSLFPLAFLLMGVFNLCILKPPFTREQSEKTSNRIIGSSLLLLVFTTVALAGDVVCWFIRTGEMLLPTDAIYTFLLVFACVLSGICVSQRNSVITKVDYSVPNPDK